LIDAKTLTGEIMVSWREIGRGMYRRFLPAVVATDLALSLPTWIVAHVAPSSVVLAVALGALLLGYATVLGVLRTRLRPDVGIDGRRSVVAGMASLGLIAAGAATFRLGSPSAFSSMARLGGLYFGASVIVTLGIFFPWIGARQTDIARPDGIAALASPMPSGVDAGTGSSISGARDRVS
jgi:hypothetical protein